MWTLTFKIYKKWCIFGFNQKQSSQMASRSQWTNITVFGEWGNYVRKWHYMFVYLPFPDFIKNTNKLHLLISLSTYFLTNWCFTDSEVPYERRTIYISEANYIQWNLHSLFLWKTAHLNTKLKKSLNARYRTLTLLTLAHWN